MIYLNCSEIVERIEKKYKLKGTHILHFHYKEHTLEDFTIHPNDLLSLISTAKNFSIEYEECDIGGRTKDTIPSLERFLKKESDHVSFTSLMRVIFYKRDSPSGLIILTSWGWVFIPGVIDYYKEIWINYTEQPKEKKEMLTKLSKKWGVKWWGDVDQPILFIASEPHIESLKNFIKSVNGFFEEVGYAEI